MRKFIAVSMLVLAAVAVPTVMIQGCSSNSGSTAQVQKCEMCAKGIAHKHYTCPMCGGDKAVAANAQPGKCACGMDLVEKK